MGVVNGMYRHPVKDFNDQKHKEKYDKFNANGHPKPGRHTTLERRFYGVKLLKTT